MPFLTSAAVIAEIENHLDLLVSPFFNSRIPLAGNVVFHSVQGNTFRAFRGFETYKPSSIFRNWATNWLQDTLTAEILQRAVESDDQYKIFHSNACEMLSDHYANCEGNRLKFAHSRKLVDLLMKYVCIWNIHYLDGDLRDRLVSRINVPLDQYSLSEISTIALGEGINIAQYRMGIVNEPLYWQLQSCIRAAVGEYPKIYFDIVAWDRGHAGQMLKFIDRMANGEVREADPRLIPKGCRE